MNEPLIPVLIFLAPFLISIALPMFFRVKDVVHPMASLALFVSLIFSVIGLWKVQDGSVIKHTMGGWMPPFGIEWHFDALSAVLSILVAAISFLVVFATKTNVESELKRGTIPFYSAVLLNTAGLFGILFTHDLFNLFVFVEVTSLTAYALIATGDRFRGNLASFRYLLMGTLGASFYLLGVGYLYAATGTLNISDMAERIPAVIESRTVLLGLFFIFIGLAIKIGLFPFHGWLPNAYAYASNPASSLIAPLSTKVSIYAFIRVFYSIIGKEGLHYFHFDMILITLGVGAIVYGSLKALAQKEFKRLLAYSSISHIGLIMLGIGINETIALVGVFLHIVFHATMKASLFLIATSAYENYKIKDILDFGKLRGKMPNTMRVCLIACLSMVGIPPLCGFFSKWFILVGAVEAGYLGVAAIIAGSSLLTALYFFRFIEQLFFNAKDQTNIVSEEKLTPLSFSYGLLSLSLIVMGVTAPFIFNWGMRILALAVN